MPIMGKKFGLRRVRFWKVWSFGQTEEREIRFERILELKGELNSVRFSDKIFGIVP
jgi:hypothetical protein